MEASVGTGGSERHNFSSTESQRRQPVSVSNVELPALGCSTNFEISAASWGLRVVRKQELFSWRIKWHCVTWYFCYSCNFIKNLPTKVFRLSLMFLKYCTVIVCFSYWIIIGTFFCLLFRPTEIQSWCWEGQRPWKRFINGIPSASQFKTGKVHVRSSTQRD